MRTTGTQVHGGTTRLAATPATALAATLTAGLLFAACASAPGNAIKPMAADFRETGTYRFEARTPEGVMAEGWVNVTRDTIIVRGTPGPCYYDREARDSFRIEYRCADRTISFDRKRPVTRATLTYPARVRGTQRVCGTWGTDRFGGPICTRYVDEIVYRVVNRTVRLVPLTG